MYDPAASDYQAPDAALNNKVILVTGASKGIGRTAALTYARLGASVILLGRETERLEQVYDLIEQQGGKQPAMVPLNLETATAQDYVQLAEHIDTTFGRLDGLLHNAGVLGTLTPLAFYKLPMWESVMRINVTAGFALTQALLPVLERADNASVVFTTSSVGRKGRSNWGAYAVSKFATEGLMQTWSEELAQATRIRVNCINPGATRTDMRAQAYPAEDPATLCHPEDIMGLYTFLMSDASIGVTGASLDAQQPR